MSPFEMGALSAFVGTLPVLLIVIVAWIRINSKISGMNRQRDDVSRALTQQLLDNRQILKTEISRLEEVLDSRLRRLEES